MAKAKIFYQCTACGGVANKWAGQCGDCGAWNTLVEAIQESSAPRGGRFGGYAGGAASTVSRLSEVAHAEQERWPSGIHELDRVLGGGLVPGSVILLGGDPGIGKSTLLLQSLASFAAQLPSLYVTGEESSQQVSLRAHRLGLDGGQILLATETCVEKIIEMAQREKPRVMVVDSVQTLFTEALQSAPGSVGQVRESAAQLVRFAKQTHTALFLVGHVTKEGALAGPRVLEHMVDTVLYFESDTGSRFRLIRAVKNRFGAANELGVFAMGERGLREVNNPSAIFLSRNESAAAGSVVMVTWEGTRPLLVEVQALVDHSPHGNPRRVTLGLEQNRLAMLLAVLHRHGGVSMYDQDVFANVVGGVRVSETASDLPTLVAVLSSLRNRPVPNDWVVFGEVGLAGEIRPVPNGQERLREAAKHGFKRAIAPRGNVGGKTSTMVDGLEVVPVATLDQALAALS
jgi:DNA repair protein RadA/Sms